MFSQIIIFRIRNFTQFSLSIAKILTLSWNIETFEADTFEADPVGVGAVLRANDAMRRDATRRDASRRVATHAARSAQLEEKSQGRCLTRFHDDQSLPEIEPPATACTNPRHATSLPLFQPLIVDRDSFSAHVLFTRLYRRSTII